MNALKYIQPERVLKLNQKPINLQGQFVMYWIQASQRSIFNHSLEYAIIKANEQGLPLIAYFGITAKYPNANQRPYWFMLEGLQQLQKDLAVRNIQMIILQQSPDEGAIELAKQASSLIVDRGYLRIQRQWREKVANEVACEVIQIESDVVVPIQSASDKEEFAARTIRPKITNKIKYFSVPVPQETLQKSSLKLQINQKSYDISDIEKVIVELELDRSVSRCEQFKGGEKEAIKALELFLKNKLNNYAVERNDPSKDATSNMSPYLHFGMISPLYILLETQKQCKQSESSAAFLEELIVRRELSMNFCFYNDKYDSYDNLPKWCKDTLESHSSDKRTYIYSRSQLEEANTHDDYWNAAQKEAIYKGKIAGYMRMYWGKKVLEWSATPQEAYENMIYLNDKYHLDGRDANGYTGVAWCFGKHDRPWTRRPIFGTIRYMVDTGLKRKFDIGNYVLTNNKTEKDGKLKKNGQQKETKQEEGLERFLKKIKKN